MQRQLRLGERGIIGFDLGAMMATARDTGICPVAASDFLALIESVAVPALNEIVKDDNGS